MGVGYRHWYKQSNLERARDKYWIREYTLDVDSSMDGSLGGDTIFICQLEHAKEIPLRFYAHSEKVVGHIETW